MSEGFNKGWLMAVKWIYDNSVKNKLTKGINPQSKYVTEMMRQLPNGCGYDSGFAEGLIYAIGKPLKELKQKIST